MEKLSLALLSWLEQHSFTTATLAFQLLMWIRLKSSGDMRKLIRAVVQAVLDYFVPIKRPKQSK